MINKILIKLKERSLLKYIAVRNASSLSPVNMVRKKEECILKFDTLANALHKKKKLTARSAKKCILQYKEFIESMQYEHELLLLKYDFKYFVEHF